MKSKAFAVFLFMTSSVTLFLHSYLGSYTRFMADDFCSVYFARRLSMLRYIWYWYLTWGGRYSAIAVDSFIKFIGPVGVRYVPSFVILVWLVVTSMALHQALKKEMNPNQVPMLSLMLGGVGGYGH